MPDPRRVSLVAAWILSSVAGCIPYAVGTTAETVAPGEPAPSLSINAPPGGIDGLSGDGVGGAHMAGDPEIRIGSVWIYVPSLALHGERLLRL